MNSGRKALPDSFAGAAADALGKRLRAALGRAGVVDGYLHLCRRCKRNGTPHAEKHAACERRRCPTCGMLLWARALPRRFRLHDTRHTTATLLLAAGVDLYAVARILRPSDPKLTFATYAHLVPGYLHEQIDRLSDSVPGTFVPKSPGSETNDCRGEPY